MRRFGLGSLAVMAVLLGMTACSSSKQEAIQKDKVQARYILHTSGPILYSPNGEPLTGGVLGRPSCYEAASNWFDRVDANHDKMIDRNEYLSDSRIQFLRMDLDGDGAIYPSELLTFRGSFEGTPKHTPSSGPVKDFTADKEEIKARGLIPKYDPDKDADRKRLQDFSDPVMSADTNLDFRVTLDEFTAQGQDVFKLMDQNHDGQLDRLEVLSTCPLIGVVR